MRGLWWCLGGLMFGLGVIGALLPVMPTTIFLILAMGCFARSSPRLEQRLLAHRRYGPTLRAWRAQRAISRAGKTYACLGISGSFILFLLGARPSLLLAASVAVICLGSAAYVLSRPVPIPLSYSSASQIASAPLSSDDLDSDDAS